MNVYGKKQHKTSTKSHDDDEFSYSGSTDDFFDMSEEDSEYQPNAKRLRTIEGNRKKIERKPTRVPNMKIQNRNALLARENRRRKKEMVESLEKKVDSLQQENRSLHKMMKSKDSRIGKLMREIDYLKSVITNRTEIVSILKTLPQFPTVNSSSSIKKTSSFETKKECTSGGSSSETLSCNTFDDEHDLDVENVATEWDEILENPFSSSSIPTLDDIALSPTSEISTEHNYSHYDGNQFDNNKNRSSFPGVCLHINTGRVSLEFCSVCHFNATNSWTENSD